MTRPFFRKGIALERVGFEILDVDSVRRAYGADACRYPRST